MNLYQKISKEFGLEDMSEAARLENIAILLDALTKNLGLRIVDELNSEDLDEFNKMADEDSDKAIEFLSSKLPKAEQLVDEEISRMKQQRDEIYNLPEEESNAN